MACVYEMVQAGLIRAAACRKLRSIVRDWIHCCLALLYYYCIFLWVLISKLSLWLCVNTVLWHKWGETGSHDICISSHWGELRGSACEGQVGDCERHVWGLRVRLTHSECDRVCKRSSGVTGPRIELRWQQRLTQTWREKLRDNTRSDEPHKC